MGGTARLGAGARRARRERRAVDPSPGGSGRYCPALARVGGGRGAIGRRYRGGALAGRGESAAWQQLADVASSDSSTSASR